MQTAQSSDQWSDPKVSILGHGSKDLKVAKELVTHYLRCAGTC